jgi:flagellar biogenesis protein FliO
MDIVRQIFSVLLVFALLAGALWMLRRGRRVSFSGTLRKNRSLESIERMSLTPQHSLHLVRIRGREVVVATHPQGCSVVAEAGVAE